MNKTFGEKVIDFHKNLELKEEFPEGIKVMNPYQNNPEVLSILSRFYTKFFSDNSPRKFIAGINPGRLGAGATGIPFTDTKRLAEECGISDLSFETHEPSSVFVYQVVKAFGGAESFYNKFYINSVCPLGFLRENKRENLVNFNYYDDRELFEILKPFIKETLKKQIDFGLDKSICFVLGKKNTEFLKEINQEEKLFKNIIALPHPRYIVQYKYKLMDSFVNEYQKALNK